MGPSLLLMASLFASSFFWLILMLFLFTSVPPDENVRIDCCFLGHELLGVLLVGECLVGAVLSFPRPPRPARPGCLPRPPFLPLPVPRLFLLFIPSLLGGVTALDAVLERVLLVVRLVASLVLVLEVFMLGFLCCVVGCCRLFFFFFFLVCSLSVVAFYLMVLEIELVSSWVSWDVTLSFFLC